MGRALAAGPAARVLRLRGVALDFRAAVDPSAREEESVGVRRFPTLDIRYVQVCYSPGGLQHVIVHAQPLLQGMEGDGVAATRQLPRVRHV